jgi:hypothetical protein
MQAGCADRAAARPEEGRSHHAGKAARTKQAGSAGSAARAAAQREEGSSHHAGQAARTMQVGSAGSADRAAARRADPRSIHSPPPPPPHTFRTPRTHRRVRDKVPLPVTLCASLFSACMRPREKLSGPGGIAGLGRNPTDAEVRSNRAIGFPTLNTFDQV